ncbi:MAG: amino acid ABC transporter substrate-binding protein [Desulfobacteraceae bacterium]|nr:amino acid ABC transporter substrate-binding protein [Desulfobacteraceae bacterium]
MRITKILMVFLLVIFLSIGNIFAQEFTILGYDKEPPKFYKERGQPKGIFIDMLRYIEKEIGYTFHIKLYPWKRSYNKALNAKGGIIGLSKTTERLKVFDYSDIMYYDELMVVVIKGKEFHFENINDLKGKKVGFLRGATFGDEFSQAVHSRLFIPVEDGSHAQRLRKLLYGRIDAALVAPGKAGVFNYIQSDPGLKKEKDKFVVLSKPLKRDPNYLGISKKLKMTGFILKFNKALKKGYETGTFQKIMDSYSN